MNLKSPFSKNGAALILLLIVMIISWLLGDFISTQYFDSSNVILFAFILGIIVFYLLYKYMFLKQLLDFNFQGNLFLGLVLVLYFVYCKVFTVKLSAIGFFIAVFFGFVLFGSAIVYGSLKENLKKKGWVKLSNNLTLIIVSVIVIAFIISLITSFSST